MIYLYGGKGYVGSNIAKYLNLKDVKNTVLTKKSSFSKAIKSKIDFNDSTIEKNSTLIYLLNGNKNKTIKDMENFCYFIKRSNIKFKTIILFSSISVYDGLMIKDLREVVTLKSNNSLRDYYGKLSAENILLKELSKSKIIIFRVGRIIGQGSYWFETIQKYIKKNKNCLIQSSAKGSFISIREICFLNHLALQGKIPAGIYNIASKSNLSYSEIMNYFSTKDCKIYSKFTIECIRSFYLFFSPFVFLLNKVKITNFPILTPGLYSSINDFRIVNIDKIKNIAPKSTWTLTKDLKSLNKSYGNQKFK